MITSSLGTQVSLRVARSEFSTYFRECLMKLTKNLVSRAKTVLYRWISVLSLGIVAGSIWVLAFWWNKYRFQGLLDLPQWVSFCIGIVVTLYLVHQTWFKGAAFWGLKHLLTYPPLWLALIPATGLFVFVLRHFDRVVEELGFSDNGEIFRLAFWWMLFSVLVVAVFSAILLKIFEKKSFHQLENSTVDPSDPIGLSDFESIKNWIEDDVPIESARDDRFSFVPMARRIANRIKVEGKSASIAVIGKLGSGKSSLAKLVAEQLAHSHVKLVIVELWRYNTPQAAVEGIIHALVDALAEEVPVVALRGVSGEYVAAMGEAGGYWPVISKILQLAPSDPAQALDQVQDIAVAIGWRYALWVEDLERYAEGTGNG
jgi:KAP family P-loop domain